MFDCSNEIHDFHNKRVILPPDERIKLSKNRKSNQARLKNSLEKDGKPVPKRFIKQGSYAMKTMISRPGNDYDIDDGALFDSIDLEGKTALQTRQMVCEALQHDGFATPPKPLPNCVRVFYAEGHHVDVPVYREVKEASSSNIELASVDWRISNPEGVTNWFESCLQAKNGPTEDKEQMRRLVRYLKFFACSRSFWTLPSGFVLSILINECYQHYDEREDRTLYDLFVAIYDRLSINNFVAHPVVSESLSTGHETEIKQLQDKLKWAIEILSVLHSSECTRLKALKAWKEVFNNDFFDDEIKEESENASVRSFNVLSSEPKSPVDKQGGGRYGKEASP